MTNPAAISVKRIRPITLGPFDYDRENYTTLLWISEGFTSYYDDLILKRTGFYSTGEYLNRIRRTLRGFETIPGRLFQTAAESSFDAWNKYFERDENSRNTSISYYDKGAAIGLLLDLKIRHETGNE